MAMASVHISLPTLTPPNLRRVNRYCLQAPKRSSSVVAMASSVATSGVKVTEGEGKLPKVVLTGSNGSEADVYLFGGCVTSWKVPNGKDLLFVRPDAVFNGKKPISLKSRAHVLDEQGHVIFEYNCCLKDWDFRQILTVYLPSDSGGVPHCFPQFGPGPMQQHGFARNLDWSIVDSENVQGDPILTLELKDGPYSHAMWDFSFQALYKITLQTKSLSTELVIKNTDNKPFSFSTALHTYFRASAQGASVKGLKGRKTLNKDPDPKNPMEGKEERDAVTFPGFVDCVYLDAPNELHLDNGLGDIISIKNTNWSDAVLWNPYLTMEACYKDFVCVENAQIGNVQLEPGNTWTATQHLSIN